MHLFLSACLLLLSLAPAATASPAPPPRQVDVVLVHGFTDTNAVFRPLVAVLEQHGCRCFAPNLRPNNFRYGVHDLTLKLSAEIDARLGPSRPFVLVALSMGGLVARDYVQNLHGDRRTRALFLVATANRGTVWANTSPGGGVRDFAVGSPFLRRLNQDVSVFRQFPVYAYWTPLDLVVVPASNSRCFFGQNRCVVVPFHQSLIKNREVMSDIADKIATLPAHPPLPPFARGKSGR